MTVGELKKALKGYRNDDVVYMVNNWETVDEDGNLTDLTELSDVTSQRIVIDMGLDFEDQTQVLLSF